MSMHLRHFRGVFGIHCQQSAWVRCRRHHHYRCNLNSREDPTNRCLSHGVVTRCNRKNERVRWVEIKPTGLWAAGSLKLETSGIMRLLPSSPRHT